MIGHSREESVYLFKLWFQFSLEKTVACQYSISQSFQQLLLEHSPNEINHFSHIPDLG